MFKLCTYVSSLSAIPNIVDKFSSLLIKAIHITDKEVLNIKNGETELSIFKEKHHMHVLFMCEDKRNPSNESWGQQNFKKI